MDLFEKCYTLFVQLLCGFIVAHFFGLCIELFEGEAGFEEMLRVGE